MKVTMQQIAERAGVSRGTVDRVLNNRGRVRPEVVERVENIADELGYQVKHNSNSRFKYKKKYKIGVITQLSDRGFMVDVHRGISDAAEELKEMDSEVVIRESTSVDAEEQLGLIDELIEEDIDGLALMPVEESRICERINELIRDRNVPVVTFNTDVLGTDRLCFIGMNNFESGRTAAGLMGMLSRGTGNVIIITGYFSNRANNDRVAGFTEEIRKSYPDMKIIGVQGCFDNSDEVERYVQNSLRYSSGVDGILIVSGGQQGLYRTLDEMKLDKRPYVIAFDRIPVNEQGLREGKTDFVIDQNGYVQGYRAIRLLSKILHGGARPEREFLYTDIKICTKYNLDHSDF